MKTSKYELIAIRGGYRVENIKGMYKTEVPYVEIPRELFEEFLDYLVNFKDIELTKAEGKLEFDRLCDTMFDEEHTELYPESVL
jgi:hypothetical protein